MKESTKKHRYNALMTAAELIRGQVEGGLIPEDLGLHDTKQLEEYRMATYYAHKVIEKLASKYKSHEPKN